MEGSLEKRLYYAAAWREKRLYDAAAKGNTESLQELLQEDEFLLDRVSFTSPNKSTPLHVATTKGHLAFVQQILIRNRRLAQQLDSQQSSPLHIASAEGYPEIVENLLLAAPHMCMSRDCQGRTPLHHAVVQEILNSNPLHHAVGQEILNSLPVDSLPSIPLHIAYLEIVKKLLTAEPDMCLSRDCQGRNPLHLAAMKGHVEILKALIQEAPSAAREMVDRDQTVLHLCVKHGQLEALKILAPKLNDLINAKDVAGDTILHMAVALRRREKKGRIDAKDDAGDTVTAAVEDKQIEIIRYLVKSTEIYLNVRNSNGQTAIDILEESQPPTVDYIKMKNILRRVRRIDTKIRIQTERVMKWLTEKGNTIMVVAVLIATVAFQAGVSPAGGTWQENSTQYSHARAGEAVMAYTHPETYKHFMRSNMISFVSSVTTIVLLMSDLPFRRWLFMWILIIIMWLTVTSLTVSFAISVFVVTPKTLGLSMPSVLKNGLGLWFAVMGILLIGSIVNWLEVLPKKKLFLKKLKKIAAREAEIENSTASQKTTETVAEIENYSTASEEFV